MAVIGEISPCSRSDWITRRSSSSHERSVDLTRLDLTCTQRDRLSLILSSAMPTVAVDKAELWERLGKEYSLFRYCHFQYTN